MRAVGARKVLGGQLLWPLFHHTDSPSLAAEEWGPASSQLRWAGGARRTRPLCSGLHGSIRAARDTGQHGWDQEAGKPEANRSG